jgi:hypothetical protein
MRKVRVSDADRQKIVDLLRQASAEGRISIAEFDERVRRAYAATTQADLEPLTADLPRPASSPAPDTAGRAAARDDGGVSWTVAVLSGNERRGRWRVARRTRAVALMGGCTLDLREAALPPGELQITAVTVMGGVEIIVPEGVEVTISGFSLMGGYEARAADLPRRPGTPLVRVRAFSIMGGVDVKSKPLRGSGGSDDHKSLGPG